MNKAQNNKIVAYTAMGRPLTLKEYKQELTDAEDEINRGEFISQEDLEKESKNW